MRFGRKNKHRLRTGVAISNETRSNQAGTVASEERNALLDSAPSPLDDAQPEDAYSALQPVDPTQLLLTALGGFQRQLTNAGTEAGNELWAHDSMDYLVTGVEVAVQQGWSDVIEALTETGRVLQTYENAGRVVECLPFLNDAYEILCLMVGDLIVDDIRSGVRDKWRSRHERVLEEVQAAGLRLIQDSDEDVSAIAQTPAFEDAMDAPSEIPFDLPPVEPAEPASVSNETGLPTLDKLPPLAEADPVAHEAVARGLKTEDEAPDDTPATDEEEGVFGSVTYLDLDAESEAGALSQLAVDVLDRLSEQFGAVENAPSDEHGYFIVRINGAITTLLREADNADNPRAKDLCAAMAEACLTVGEKEPFITDALIDLGFGFCAAYPEAFGDEPVEHQIDWLQECRQTVSRWKSEKEIQEPVLSDDAAVEDSPPVETTPDPLEEAAPPPGKTEVSAEPEPIASEIDTAEEPRETLELDPTEEEPPAEAPDTPEQDDTATEVAEAEPAAPAPDEMSSSELLAAAQEAATKGDAEGAKYYALLAAAAIARDESLRANRTLIQTEGRLKESLEAADTARQAVQNAEQNVMAAATEVSSIEAELGTVKERCAQVEQKREDIQANIASVEERIAELDTERNVFLGELGTIDAELKEARGLETQAQERVDLQEKVEVDERRKLEMARQDAKDLLNAGAELEGAVGKARQDLEREKSALAGIEQTVQDTCSKGEPGQEDSSMLF